MHSLSCLRQIRVLTILLPIAIVGGCGEGTGPQRIQNEPADPFSGPPASCAESLTFETICDQEFEFANFEGGVLSIIDNPQTDGNNGSARVLQMQKFRATSGATFGGAVLDFSAVGSDTISAGDTYTIKVWSQRPVNVLFEPEGGGPGSGAEVAHGGTGWEELTFSVNFTGTTSGFVFIFDNGTLGDAGNDPDNWTFYIDDISLPTGGDGGGPGDNGFPITFDGGSSPAVTEFGGAGFAIEPGPSGGDGNALKIVRDGGEVFAGAWIAVPEIPNDAGDQTISALVFSPTAGVPMVAKAEYGDNMGSGDVSANEPVVSGWQTLTWTFTNLAPPNVYNRFTILPNLGTVGSGESYYFDNIDLVGVGGGGGDTTTLPVDFESDAASYDFGPDGGFEGGAASVVTNPDQSGINTSTQVGQMLKFPGAVFGGATLAIETATVEAGSAFTMKVWSQRAVPVLLQPEPQGPGSGVEVMHGGTGWEELTFSLPGLSGDVSGITIIFDNGTAGAADTDPDNWTFYFDDITLVPPDAGGGDNAIEVSDFEGDPNSYDFGPDGGFEGGAASVVANPDQSGINTSAQVGRMLKFPGAVFGGATLALSDALNVAAGSSFTMKVWSQRPVPVLLQPEPQGPGSGVEVMHGGTGWEELTFSLPGLSGTVSGITIIFDNGTAGAADTDPDNWTFYFDDIKLIPPSGGGGGGDVTTLPVDFQNGINSYDFGPFGGFEGGAASVVTNPDQSGINTSTQVGQMLKFDGAVFGGATLVIESATVEAGSSFTMKVWSQRPVPVLLQPEPQGPGSGVEVMHGGTGWEELTFSLPGLSGTVSGITIIFDNGTAGAAATDPTNWTFYFDDITLVPPGSGGGGDGGFPITFDEATPPVVTEFGGAGYAIEAGPAGGDGDALKIVRDGGDVFAGAWVAVPAIPSDTGTQTVSALVYSPTAGIPMVAKAEFGENTGSGDTPANETVVVGWQTLTWTFTNLQAANVYNRFVILPNLGTVDTATSYYFDNIDLVDAGSGGGGTVLITFDEPTPPAVTEFGGAGYAIEAGPAGGDGDALKIVRDGGDVFAGAWVAISGIPNDAGTQTISALVYSPTAGVPMVTKLEFGENTGTGDTPANETVVAGWQTLTWTYTNLAPPNDYNRFVMLPNLGAVDTATSYYFDNITLAETDGGGGGGGGGTGDGSLPVTFDEAMPPAVTEFGGAGYAIEAGPAGGDGKALKIVRDGGDVFAGAFVAVSGVPNDAGAQTISALVYSPTAGIPMVTKLEFGQNMGTGDVAANEAVVVGWQTLTWTFTNLVAPNDYNRFVILPNLGTVDTATSYYFDNIDLVGGGGGGGGGGTGDLVTDGGFEAAGTAGLQPPWVVFENGGTVSVSNLNDNGGDYSARLQADASAGTSFPILKIERVGGGSVTGGESVTISFDVIDVDTAGVGKTFVAELFTERADPPGGATNEVILGGYDLTSSWQTRVFNTNLGADAAGGVSLLFKADCGGNTSCAMDVFIDNVSIVIN